MSTACPACRFDLRQGGCRAAVPLLARLPLVCLPTASSPTVSVFVAVSQAAVEPSCTRDRRCRRRRSASCGSSTGSSSECCACAFVSTFTHHHIASLPLPFAALTRLAVADDFIPSSRYLRERRALLSSRLLSRSGHFMAATQHTDKSQRIINRGKKKSREWARRNKRRSLVRYPGFGMP
jgi:hypothetical protein